MPDPTKPTYDKTQHWSDVSKLSEHITFLEAKDTRLTTELAGTKHVLLDSQRHALVLANEVLALQQELTEARVQHDACHQTSDDLLGERDRTITALEKTLESIRDHDGQRWTWNDGIAEPQTDMQEIAKAALAASGETEPIVASLGRIADWAKENGLTSEEWKAYLFTGELPYTDPASTVECPCTVALNRLNAELCAECWDATYSRRRHFNCSTCVNGRIPKPVGEETDD